MGFIVPMIFLIFVVYLLVSNIRVVPQAQAYVIETLGRFKCVWDAGLHFKIPFFERIAKKVSLKEQVLDFPPQPVITKDNVTISIDSVVFARVFDPRLYTYGVESPIAGLQNLSATTLRNIIGELELDQTLTSRDEINRKMEAILDQATDPWGIKVTRVELKNITPPKEIEEVMTKQMRAERDAQIALAQGRARSIELVYEAEAEGLRKLNEANVGESVLRLKGLEALKDVSDGRATKIYLPSDIASVVSSLGLVGEALGVGDATPVDHTDKADVQAANDPCIHPETGRGGRDAAYTTAKINAE